MQPDHPPAITQGIEAGNPCDSHTSMKEGLQNAWSIDHTSRQNPLALKLTLGSKTVSRKCRPIWVVRMPSGPGGSLRHQNQALGSQACSHYAQHEENRA